MRCDSALIRRVESLLSFTMNDIFFNAIQRYWQQHPQYLEEAQQQGHTDEILPAAAILFDMDGVLFDSMPGHARAWTLVCREAGLNTTPEEIYMNEGRTAQSTIGLLTQRQWGRETNPEEVEQLYARKCEVFNSYPEAPKMPGAQELLTQVIADRIKTVVVTGSGQASLLDRLLNNYPGCFDRNRIVTSHDVKQGKPAPEPYIKGLEKAGNLRPWQAVVIENAPLGVRAAVNAGIFTIAVNTGPLPPKALNDEGAAIVLDSMQALTEAWPKLRFHLGIF